MLVQLSTKKLSRRAFAIVRPRVNGRFAPVPKPVRREPVDWNVLYQFRDDWRTYRQQEANAKHEARWGGVRSIITLSLISAVLVGMLVAGVLT
jgi:hypothetical protein